MDILHRYCLTLDLKEDPALIAEYIDWHRAEKIWPEVVEGIKAVGITGMEIYRFGTRMFMIVEAGPAFDFERDMARLAQLPRQQEWEAFVSAFQQTVPGSAPGSKWQKMEQIFRLP
jgi:L-rhamnose mutarotase